MDESLDALVRRVDEDRWLASRFAPASVRGRLVAIYALNHELARIASVVREPSLAAIRLAWWRDALGDIHAGGRPPAHPVLQAYAAVAASVAGAAWSDIIEARAGDSGTPFASWEAALAHVEGTEGAVFRLAMSACGAAAEASPLTRFAGQAWGIVALARRRLLPGPPAEAAARARRAYEEARSSARGQPAIAFPAIGHLALVPARARALELGRDDVPLLWRQVRLIAAAASGRV